MDENTLKYECKPCKHRFVAEADFTEGSGETKEYFAHCKQCNELAPVVYYYKNLMKAWRKSTGPTSDNGKNKSAKNSLGRSTEITRFNAVKHMAYAEEAPAFPARPGRYEECAYCELNNKGRKDECLENKFCVVKFQRAFKMQIAFKTNNPDVLQDEYAQIQANTLNIMHEMQANIRRRGVEIETPKFMIDLNGDKDGKGKGATILARDESGEVITEVKPNPMLKLLIDAQYKTGTTLTDLNLVPALSVKSEGIEGNIAGASQLDVDQINNDLSQKLEGVADVIKRAQQKKEQSPAYLSYSDEQKVDQ